MISEKDENDRFAQCPLATDFRAIEALGYSVTLSGDPKMPYHITGKRNTSYTLLRNVPNPTTLFVVYNRPGKFGVAKIHGYSWFQERDGKLQPCR
jgi:hypothetical protein